MASAMLVARQSAIDEALERIEKFGVYGYQPSEVGAAIFTSVYGVCCLLLTYAGIRHRRWWMLATLALGAALECGGNAIRIYSHHDYEAVDPYIAQEVLLVITPAFFAAAQFSILSKICILFGPEYIAPFKPQWLIPFFVVIDVASMAVQGGGSGTAAISEINGDSVDTVNNNGYIIVAGLAVQLAGYLAFNALFALFVIRIRRSPPKGDRAEWWNGKMRFFLAATWLSALFILGRSVFRTVQMSTGWIGPVGTIEWFYLVFDATFVSMAVIILVVVSPARYMPRDLVNPNGAILPSHDNSHRPSDEHEKHEQGVSSPSSTL